MIEKRIAVFPGSFDPVTRGHENVLRRALPLFDEIIIGIGNNSTKKYYFPLEKRINFLKKVFEQEPKIKVLSYSSLTIDFCKENGARFILRGLRTSSDFEFERAIAQMNHSMNAEIETVFILAEPGLSHISSTIVRDILLHKGNVSEFIPSGLSI